ncbi:MAG: hypothetical protein AB1635_06520 [Acidobacteriota bacterium]
MIPRWLAAATAAGALAAAMPAGGQPGAAGPIVGLTAVAEVTAAYDAAFDADFEALPARLAAACGPAPPEACAVVDAAGLWWRVQLDPASRARDGALVAAFERAIAATEAWTVREPVRAEAWFYRGAALGVRVQYKVLRGQRTSAARDGKRVKDLVERALALDPALDDARLGRGAYRYYAAVAPAVLRVLRWLLLLPGGDRTQGLSDLQHAADHGRLTRWEALYQLHLAYLWYEHRFDDALAIVGRLQERFPRNPHFWQLEAEIRDVYFGDAAGSLRASDALERRARDGLVHMPDLARTVARLNAAKQHAALGDRARALALARAIVDERPEAPADAAARARAFVREWSR